MDVPPCDVRFSGDVTKTIKPMERYLVVKDPKGFARLPCLSMLDSDIINSFNKDNNHFTNTKFVKEVLRQDES